jgi:hypothetical protein
MSHATLNNVRYSISSHDTGFGDVLVMVVRRVR